MINQIADRLDFDITLLNGSVVTIYVTGVYLDTWKDEEGLKQGEEGFHMAFWSNGIEFSSDEYNDYCDELAEGLSDAICKFYENNYQEN